MTTSIVVSLNKCPPDRTIDRIILNENFIFGYAGNKKYILSQSLEFPSQYDVYSLSYDRAKVYYNSYHSMEMVNISKNPGRIIPIKNMWLRAAWRMWFGNKFFEIISKDPIRGFKKANVIKEFPNGVVFMELYQDPFKSETNENIEKQILFREWLKMDDLKKID